MDLEAVPLLVSRVKCKHPRFSLFSRLGFPLALSFLVASCAVSAFNPPSSEFTPRVDGLSLSPRNNITLLKRAEVDQSVYTQIGSVETSLLLARCDADVGARDCSPTDRTPDDAVAAALKKAQKEGGDVAVLARSYRDSKYGSRNGTCQFYTTTTERVSTYKAGDSSTSSTTKQVRKCTRYEQIRTRSDYQYVTLDVYRDESGLRDRMGQALATAAEEGKREEAAKRQQYALQEAQQAERQRQEQAVNAEKLAFEHLLREGSEAEVAAKLLAEQPLLQRQIFYEPQATDTVTVTVDPLRYAIAHLNVGAVRALLAAGADPDGRTWRRRDHVPPPIWFALITYRKNNSCPSLIAGRPLPGFIPDHRTASGEHKAILILKELIDGGAQLQTAGQRKSKPSTVVFGYDEVESPTFLRAFANVGTCQPPGEQAEMMRMVINAGGYDKRSASETRKVLVARADDWEQRLLPDAYAATRRPNPADQAYGRKMVAMRLGFIAEARRMIEVLDEQNPRS